MKKMRILWIPHGTWMRKIRQRDQYLIERLKENHEIHILTWSEPEGPGVRYFLNPIIHLKALRDFRKKDGVLQIHHFRRLNLSRFSLIRKINEKFFQKKIRQIVAEDCIDAVICGPNQYLNGFPPFDLDVPLVFDYVDLVSDKSVKEKYLKNSDVVLCVSNVLLKDSKKYNQNSVYLPNGVDIEKFKNAKSNKIRSEYGLENKKVVGLIGLTFSKSLYFLDALPIIKKSIGEIKYLVIGDNHLLSKMKKRAKKYPDDIVFTGWVDYNEIQDYFGAIDVGIYPVDKNLYFDSASPIKVLEYTASEKPVVTPSLSELEYLNFRNIVFHEPNAEDFADKIIYSLSNSFEFPDLSDYDWEKLTDKLEKILYKVVA